MRASRRRRAEEIRAELELGPLRSTLLEQLERAHPAYRLGEVTLQSTLVENHIVRDRALALLSAFFSVVAIVLVVVGLYGVLSYDVVRRTKEIGIRLALGAQSVRVIGFVLSEIGGMALTGLVMGAAGAMITGRFMTALLFDVRPSEMWSIAAPLTCLLLACVLSSLIPAVRATRIDPTIALRHE